MCFGPLDVVYDHTALKKVVTRERIEKGPASMCGTATCSRSRINPGSDPRRGFTPLVKAERLGAELGLRNLYLKNDSMNPTNSSKTAWYRSRSAGPRTRFRNDACASPATLANAVAAYSARPARMFCVHSCRPRAGEGREHRVFTPTWSRVTGQLRRGQRLCSQLLESTPGPSAHQQSGRFYAEGSKT